MKDLLMDGVIDTLKILPYLLITFLILEFIEHKLDHKNYKILTNNKKYGPFVGGILGGLPQCGFSSMAANLFSARVITMGTLIAVFLSTSDEMLPVMLSEKASLGVMAKIVGFKIIIGILVGLIVDVILRKKSHNLQKDIAKLCEEEDCECESEGILLSSIKHTLKIGLFILIANLLINLLLYYVGEDLLANSLLSHNLFTYFIASLIGLIPNCAGSVIITELYLKNLMTLGTMLSGLLTGSGLGILLLFKTNKNMHENLLILAIIYFIGVIIGLVVDLFV